MVFMLKIVLNCKSGAAEWRRAANCIWGVSVIPFVFLCLFLGFTVFNK